MNLGTPRKLLHAAGFTRNPEIDHHDPTSQPDPVERTVVVDEPAVPDHAGELAGQPVHPAAEAADDVTVPDDVSGLLAEWHNEAFPENGAFPE